MSSFLHITVSFLLLFFFFNDTATTEIYTLSLHDALPSSPASMISQRYPPTSRRRSRLHTRGELLANEVNHLASDRTYLAPLDNQHRTRKSALAAILLPAMRSWLVKSHVVVVTLCVTRRVCGGTHAGLLAAGAQGSL